MIFLFFAVICGALTLSSIIREPRWFRNSIFLLTTILFLFLGIMMESDRAPLIATILSLILVIVIPLSVLAVAVFLLINGIIMVRKEGRRIQNLLSFGAGMAIFLVVGLILYMALVEQNLSTNKKALIALILFLSAYIGFTFVAFLLYSFLYSQLPKEVKCDYVIIHGAGLLHGNQISPLLAGRIEKGIEVYRKGGCRAKFVVSGGKGANETISEAEAMRDYLIKRGIPSPKILMEKESKTTFENLQFCRKLLDPIRRPYHCVFVTSNYHVFRTSLYARKIGIDAQGVGSKTALYYWPSAVIREYVAVMRQFKWGFLVPIIPWLLFYLVSCSN
ncbi:MAG: YdcF family protein [Oscillospiraceae bacterium]|nr:conserved membrane protein of unknown function [Ruminococcaceae bacterium BL-4]